MARVANGAWGVTRQTDPALADVGSVGLYPILLTLDSTVSLNTL